MVLPRNADRWTKPEFEQRCCSAVCYLLRKLQSCSICLQQIIRAFCPGPTTGLWLCRLAAPEKLMQVWSVMFSFDIAVWLALQFMLLFLFE